MKYEPKPYEYILVPIVLLVLPVVLVMWAVSNILDKLWRDYDA